MKANAIRKGQLIQVRDGQHHHVYARVKQIDKDEAVVHVIHSGNHEHNQRKHVDLAECRGLDELEALLAIARKAPQKDLFTKLAAAGDPFVLKLGKDIHQRKDLINHYQSQIDRLQQDADAQEEAQA